MPYLSPALPGLKTPPSRARYSAASSPRPVGTAKRLLAALMATTLVSGLLVGESGRAFARGPANPQTGEPCPAGHTCYYMSNGTYVDWAPGTNAGDSKIEYVTPEENSEGSDRPTGGHIGGGSTQSGGGGRDTDTAGGRGGGEDVDTDDDKDFNDEDIEARTRRGAHRTNPYIPIADSDPPAWKVVLLMGSFHALYLGNILLGVGLRYKHTPTAVTGGVLVAGGSLVVIALADELPPLGGGILGGTPNLGGTSSDGDKTDEPKPLVATSSAPGGAEGSKGGSDKGPKPAAQPPVIKFPPKKERHSETRPPHPRPRPPIKRLPRTAPVPPSLPPQAIPPQATPLPYPLPRIGEGGGRHDAPNRGGSSGPGPRSGGGTSGPGTGGGGGNPGGNIP